MMLQYTRRTLTRVSLNPGCALSSAGGQPAAQAHVQRAVSGSQPSTRAPQRGCGCGHRAAAVAAAAARQPASRGAAAAAHKARIRAAPRRRKNSFAPAGAGGGAQRRVGIPRSGIDAFPKLWTHGSQPALGALRSPVAEQCTLRTLRSGEGRGKWDWGRVREGCRGPACCAPGRNVDCSVHIAHHTAAVMVKTGFWTVALNAQVRLVRRMGGVWGGRQPPLPQPWAERRRVWQSDEFS